MNKHSQQAVFFFLLKFSIITVFLGRAVQYMFWDAPYRTLLWDQEIIEPIISSVFKIEWTEWASSSNVDEAIQNLIHYTGILFFLNAVAILFYSKKRAHLKFIIYPGIFCLLMLAALETKEKFYNIGQFFEHASQFGAPIIFIGFVDGWLTKTSTVNFIKVAVGLTFFCHGLYAINYYPRPGSYVDMYINTLGISENLAHNLIFIAGIVDLALPFLFLIKKLDNYTLLYACFWGIVTAFARTTSGFDYIFPLESLNQVWYTSVYRLGHGLLPLSAFYLKEHVQNFLFKTNDSTKTSS